MSMTLTINATGTQLTKLATSADKGARGRRGLFKIGCSMMLIAAHAIRIVPIFGGDLADVELEA